MVTMESYEEKILHELILWQRKMTKKPSLSSQLTKGLQRKANRVIPEKVHNMITMAIKNMVEAVLVGSKFVAKKRSHPNDPISDREKLVLESLSFYKKAAATSGAGTGAGGILLGLADFPILISLKLKFLFDAASFYGFNVNNFEERLYILHVFQLTFSSQEIRREVYGRLFNWDQKIKEFPLRAETFDWRSFQQEYRDYIDLVKMMQLVPGVGAIVGAIANYRLMDKLGETAMNAYRMRLLNRGEFQTNGGNYGTYN